MMKAKGMRAGGVAVKGMKAGGVANKGMHRMPDGTMMENSDMKTMGKTMGVAPSYSNTAKKSGNTAKREDAGPAKNKVRGAMPMVEKHGKKVPAFAADGKGKMRMGGAVGTKGYIAGGKVTKGGAAGGRSAPRGR